MAILCGFILIDINLPQEAAILMHLAAMSSSLCTHVRSGLLLISCGHGLSFNGKPWTYWVGHDVFTLRISSVKNCSFKFEVWLYRIMENIECNKLFSYLLNVFSYVVCFMAGTYEVSTWLSIFATKCKVFDEDVASKFLWGDTYVSLITSRFRSSTIKFLPNIVISRYFNG